MWLDARPKSADIAGWLALRRRLKSGGFTRVYDLQTSDRSSFYSYLFWPGARPEWSGIARGASHPHANPKRDFMHTIERQAEQLAHAGIVAVPAPDFGWLAHAPMRFTLPKPFALLVPGGAAHRPEKRWPVAHYAALATEIAKRGMTPVVLGSASESSLAHAIAAVAPRVVDLTGQTDLVDLFVLARDAALCVGNDTGPMHVAAAMGCPTVVLFSHASDPALCAPRGARVAILQRADLTALRIDDVLKAAPA